ncbi:MAG: GTP cyclohydrolase IIa [Candidatus Lokiarchaeota archaeon]|nr:GTP cyclohydrolase IIa [Candidatus Lokiarchaeota archaeon]
MILWCITLIQVTLIQIDNFGPYTETLGNNREHKIQILLSEIFIELQKLFSEKNGIVFSTSMDNLIAISNGFTIEDHQEILNAIETKFPVTVSMGIGAGETPLKAEADASKALRLKGSAQSDRKKVLGYNGHSFPISGEILVAHVDINFYTRIATDINAQYENFLNLNKTYLTLMEDFKKYGALCFFNGGDNFISICPNSITTEDFQKIISSYEERHAPWKLKIGLGKAQNILDALSRANKGLHKIRTGNNIEKIVFLE